MEDFVYFIVNHESGTNNEKRKIELYFESEFVEV